MTDIYTSYKVYFTIVIVKEGIVMDEYFNKPKMNEMIPEDNMAKNTSGYFDTAQEDEIKKRHKKIKKLKKKKRKNGFLQKKDKKKYSKLKKKVKTLKHNNKMSDLYYQQHLASLKKQNEILKFILMQKVEGSDKIFEDLFIKKISQEIENNFIDSDGEFID